MAAVDNLTMRTHSVDAEEKQVFLDAYLKYRTHAKARAVAGVPKSRVLKWVQEDEEFADAFCVVFDQVQEYLRRRHLEAANREGKATQFWKHERVTADPATHSQEGIALRAREELAVPLETRYDAVETTDE